MALMVSAERGFKATGATSIMFFQKLKSKQTNKSEAQFSSFFLQLQSEKLPKMGKVCFYRGCKTTTRTSDIKFVSFVKPWRDIERTRKWIQLSGRFVPEANITKNTWICAKHFSHDANLNWMENSELTPFPFEFASVMEEEDKKRKEMKSQENPIAATQPLKTYEKHSETSFKSVALVPSCPRTPDFIDYEGKL